MLKRDMNHIRNLQKCNSIINSKKPGSVEFARLFYANNRANLSKTLEASNKITKISHFFLDENM